MHPIINTLRKFLALMLVWAIVTTSLCALVALGSELSLGQSLLLYGPLYFLCVLFIFPNYYICRGLPLGAKGSKITFFGSHGLALAVALCTWYFIAIEHLVLLNSWQANPLWNRYFNQSLVINVLVVASLFELMVLAHYLYFALEKSRDLEKNALEQKLLISEAELQSLKATVHPHFLFNALNTLSSITVSEPEQAQRFCLLLAEFLRYSVAYSKKDLATLDDEICHVQNYLGIERERFGKRLKTNFQIDDSLRAVKVPPLILFPLVENAIKHGIDSCLEGGTLSITARSNDAKSLVVTVDNPVDELGRKLKGVGHGQASVERRLKSRYGTAGKLKSQLQAGRFTTQLILPLE